MIVSHRQKFIFFHNPKCAGTSMRDALASFHDDTFSFWGIFDAPFFRNDIDHTHLRLWELQVLFPRILEAARSYRSVILVRNPYERFISAIDEHFKKFRAHVPLPSMEPAGQIDTIERFIDETLTIGAITTDYRFIHFSPQTWFITLGDRQIPADVLPMDKQGLFIPRAFECLGLPAMPVTPNNPARLKPGNILASARIAGFVRRFYALDFAYFSAIPALRGLLEMPTPSDTPPDDALIERDFFQSGYPSLLDDIGGFNEAEYLALNPGVAAAIQAGDFPDAWAHYELHGRAEGRQVCRIDEAFYLNAHPAVAGDISARLAPNAYYHYLMIGRRRGYSPHAGSGQANAKT